MTEEIKATVHNIDAPPVKNQQEALTLMLHHLGLAARYFEATPEDDALCKAAIIATLDDHGKEAALAWFDEMDAAYRE